jgi:hypothetical protein
LTDDFGVQVSYKFGSVLEHMVNVRGETPEELAENCRKVEQLVPNLIQLGELFKPPTEEQAIGEVRAQLGGEVIAQTCAHGPMIYKTGMGKNGSPWKAWMCQAPMGAQKCNPIWLK